MKKIIFWMAVLLLIMAIVVPLLPKTPIPAPVSAVTTAMENLFYLSQHGCKEPFTDKECDPDVAEGKVYAAMDKENTLFTQGIANTIETETLKFKRLLTRQKWDYLTQNRRLQYHYDIKILGDLCRAMKPGGSGMDGFIPPHPKRHLGHGAALDSRRSRLRPAIGHPAAAPHSRPQIERGATGHLCRPYLVCNVNKHYRRDRHRIV